MAEEAQRVRDADERGERERDHAEHERTARAALEEPRAAGESEREGSRKPLGKTRQSGEHGVQAPSVGVRDDGDVLLAERRDIRKPERQGLELAARRVRERDQRGREQRAGDAGNVRFENDSGAPLDELARGEQREDPEQRPRGRLDRHRKERERAAQRPGDPATFLGRWPSRPSTRTPPRA